MLGFMMGSRWIPEGSFGLNSYVSTGGSFGAGVLFGVILFVAIVWTLYWKYRAIWYAVKHDQKIWTLAFLVINSLGIVEILYLYWLSKYHKS